MITLPEKPPLAERRNRAVELLKHCQEWSNDRIAQEARVCISSVRIYRRKLALMTKYERARELIRENPDWSAKQVAEATGVSANLVNRYRREMGLGKVKSRPDLLYCPSCLYPVEEAIEGFCASCAFRSPSLGGVPHRAIRGNPGKTPREIAAIAGCSEVKIKRALAQFVGPWAILNLEEAKKYSTMTCNELRAIGRIDLAESRRQNDCIVDYLIAKQSLDLMQVSRDIGFNYLHIYRIAKPLMLLGMINPV